jgi:tRNA1Val (adenine37-N6)-methyltransferase
MASIFRFKQFEVDQSDCAMKINTDGVLLASLLEIAPVERVLDVGTGTGVIALMLAQRLGDSRVEAVEVDALAALMADKNFRNSIFRERLTLHASSFQQLETTGTYDLIVSNPPFYTDSLHNPDDRRKLARHTDLDFFAELLDFASLRLSNQGKLILILPTALADTLVKISTERGLYCSTEVRISSFEGESVLRKIVTFERMPAESVAVREFIIYAAKGIYSEAYRTALAPYFLAF